jgi:hypothetical protein
VPIGGGIRLDKVGVTIFNTYLLSIKISVYFNNNKRWGDKVTVQGKACSLISNHLSLYNSAWI